MWDNKVLKQKARERMKVNYWKMVLVGLLIALISGGASSSSGVRSTINQYRTGAEYQTEAEYQENILFDGDSAFGQPGFGGLFGGIAIGLVFLIAVLTVCLAIFVFNPLMVGGRRFFYRNIYEKAELKEVGFGFDRNYIGNVKTLFLMDLYTALWSLLFIIPGIVKAYEYRMIPYLLAENPNMDTEEAFATSKRMMDGYKLGAFWFDLTFIGWHILGALTLGVVNVFWVNPYYHQSAAMLYDALKFEDQQRMQQEQTAWQNGTQY